MIHDTPKTDSLPPRSGRLLRVRVPHAARYRIHRRCRVAALALCVRASLRHVLEVRQADASPPTRRLPPTRSALPIAPHLTHTTASLPGGSSVAGDVLHATVPQSPATDAVFAHVLNLCVPAASAGALRKLLIKQLELLHRVDALALVNSLSAPADFGVPGLKLMSDPPQGNEIAALVEPRALVSRLPAFRGIQYTFQSFRAQRPNSWVAEYWKHIPAGSYGYLPAEAKKAPAKIAVKFFVVQKGRNNDYGPEVAALRRIAKRTAALSGPASVGRDARILTARILHDPPAKVGNGPLHLAVVLMELADSDLWDMEGRLPYNDVARLPHHNVPHLRMMTAALAGSPARNNTPPPLPPSPHPPNLPKPGLPSAALILRMTPASLTPLGLQANVIYGAFTELKLIYSETASPATGVRGLIHMDIKPDNFLYLARSAPGVKGRFHVFVSDFGGLCDEDAPFGGLTFASPGAPERFPRACWRSAAFGLAWTALLMLQCPQAVRDLIRQQPAQRRRAAPATTPRSAFPDLFRILSDENTGRGLARDTGRQLWSAVLHGLGPAPNSCAAAPPHFLRLLEALSGFDGARNDFLPWDDADAAARGWVGAERNEMGNVVKVERAFASYLAIEAGGNAQGPPPPPPGGGASAAAGVGAGAGGAMQGGISANAAAAPARNRNRTRQTTIGGSGGRGGGASSGQQP